MVECIVDCEELVYGDGRVLLLPYSVNGHVHEVIVRCADCAYCTRYDGRPVPGYCRKHSRAVWDFTRFCPDGVAHGRA